ncbi:MAG TPA: RES family NAD+ phosphorylase [Pantanalinema sp.]
MIYRIFNAKRSPVDFRPKGPSDRFDHHRGPGLALGFEPRGCDAARDPERRVLYAGIDLTCCLVERFRETRVIQGGTNALAKLRVTRSLKLLDLRGMGTLRNGVTAEIAKEPDRLATQAWSRYFVGSGIYGNLDGIVWPSRVVDLDTFVFFESADGAFEVLRTIRLNDPLLRAPIDALVSRTAFVRETNFY